MVRDIVHPAAVIAFDIEAGRLARKLLDVSRLHRLGWTHKFDLRAGVQDTYRRFSSTKYITEARLEQAQAVSSLGTANR
jgi:nucleoside-diphosphate-sugar epimerase